MNENNLKKEKTTYTDEQLIHDLQSLYSPDEYDKKEVLKNMKNKKRTHSKKHVIAAACALLVVSLPLTGFGESIVETVKRATSPSGRIVVNEDQIHEAAKTPAFPDALKGKIFDENGKEITSGEQLATMEPIFSKDGREISNFSYDEKTGAVSFEYVDELDRYKDDSPVDQIADRLSFTPYILSGDYEYMGSKVFAEGDEKADYVTFNYQKNGRKISLHERISTPETGFETGGEEKVEEVTVGGTKLIIQGSSMYFERDGLLIDITAKGGDKDDLVELYKDLSLFKK